MLRSNSRQRGFTYIGLLFAVAILGITLASVGVVWSAQMRRERESQLLFVGDQYRQAIGRYLQAGGTYPQSLADLVEDKRAPMPRRFLRRLYPDPMTGAADWELIQNADGGIMGVASSSQQQPIKVANFRPLDAAFENAECYCGWKFIFLSRNAGRRRVLPPPTPATTPLPSSP